MNLSWPAVPDQPPPHRPDSRDVPLNPGLRQARVQPRCRWRHDWEPTWTDAGDYNQTRRCRRCKRRQQRSNA